jgi:streptogramin lyase
MKSDQKITPSRRSFIKIISLIPFVNILPLKRTFPVEKENKWRNGTIQRFAGLGTPGFSGDNALAKLAKLNGPAGLAIDLNDNVYIAEIGNSIIRKIDAKTNIITTIAGNGQAGYSGDGNLATTAELNRPEGVFIDKEENVYIADSGNQRIRKVTKKTGIISTIAGTGESGFNFHEGNALDAKLNHPSGIVVDSGFNIYFNDYSNDLI